MNVYNYVVLEDQAIAVELLPSLPSLATFLPARFDLGTWYAVTICTAGNLRIEPPPDESVAGDVVCDGELGGLLNYYHRKAP